MIVGELIGESCSRDFGMKLRTILQKPLLHAFTFRLNSTSEPTGDTLDTPNHSWRQYRERREIPAGLDLIGKLKLTNYTFFPRSASGVIEINYSLIALVGQTDPRVRN
ncbi:hypothetical protein PUN28_002531 [Cardiocondyla obscurior]|uniref:Uncharacterized protein n=1 Tax=Cardiocondyla obscurior TaxID=286306 RepID=A0AAW2GUV2_9HYME